MSDFIVPSYRVPRPQPQTPWRLIWLGAGVAGAAVLVGLGMWIASGIGPHTVPVIQADSRPLKIKPEDPGGMQIANQDDLIYDMPFRKNAQPTLPQGQLAPPSEAPAIARLRQEVTPPPAAQSGGPTVSVDGMKGTEILAPSTGPRANPPLVNPSLLNPSQGGSSASDTDAASAAVGTPAGNAAPAGSVDSNTALLQRTPGGAVAAGVAPPAANQAATNPAASQNGIAPRRTGVVSADPVPLGPAPTVPATTTPPPPIPADLGVPGHGRAQVQMGALNSQEAAQGEWARISKKVPELFGQRSPVITEYAREGQPVMWRLRTGGFTNMAQARAFCDALRARSIACIAIP